MDLRQLSMSFNGIHFEEKRNIQCLLEKAKLLERLRLSLAVNMGLSLVGVLSTCARTVKVLDLTVPLYQHHVPPLAGLCEELEAMAGHNTLEVLSFGVCVEAHHSEYFVGSTIQKVENVLVKPGWSALRQVSFKLLVIPWEGSADLTEALQSLDSLPDKYLNHLPKLESVVFDYSVYPASYAVLNL